PRESVPGAPDLGTAPTRANPRETPPPARRQLRGGCRESGSSAGDSPVPECIRKETTQRWRQKRFASSQCAPSGDGAAGTAPETVFFFLPKPSTNAKLPGIRNTPRNVATNIPQKTAVPMTFWAPAPAPLASISG